MINILDRAKEKNKTVIFDESFIDFADKDIRYSFINNKTLEEYPNLIAIKSISKSYGIPGFRIGVMATSNKEILCTTLLFEFMLILDEHRQELSGELTDKYFSSVTDELYFKMVKVTDYIKNNLTDDNLTQSEMAKRAGISKDYFSRIFKEITGLNYNKWLNLIRVEKAAELMLNDNMSLTEIAMLSGFQSISSFNRVFKEQKNMSPSEYRAGFSA